MSPKRGDRVTVPAPDEQWELRYATADAVTGWDELCRGALNNTRRRFEILRENPRSGAGHDRQHRPRGDLGVHSHNGKTLEQWEFDVTAGGRVRYAIDDDARTVWIVHASPRHPKDTE